MYVYVLISNKIDFQARLKEEEEEKTRQYEAYMAGKKAEEEEEAWINEETSHQIKAMRSNVNDQSGFNEAILNLLENYNGKFKNWIKLPHS